MGKTLKREKLEDLRDFNKQIQEESWYWRQKENELEKELSKHQDSITTMREELNRNILELLQLEEKFT
jgi:hypothetical protein